MKSTPATLWELVASGVDILTERERSVITEQLSADLFLTWHFILCLPLVLAKWFYQGVLPVN